MHTGNLILREIGNETVARLTHRTVKFTEFQTEEDLRSWVVMVASAGKPRLKMRLKDDRDWSVPERPSSLDR